MKSAAEQNPGFLGSSDFQVAPRNSEDSGYLLQKQRSRSVSPDERLVVELTFIGGSLPIRCRVKVLSVSTEFS